MGLDITISEKEPDVFMIVLSGEINTQTHQALEDRAKEVIGKAKALVLDMGKVSYISSMGLSAIFRIQMVMQERSATVALVNLQPSVQQVFQTMKIITPQMFASLSEADEYLDKFLDGVQKGTIKPPDPFA